MNNHLMNPSAGAWRTSFRGEAWDETNLESHPGGRSQKGSGNTENSPLGTSKEIASRSQPRTITHHLLRLGSSLLQVQVSKMKRA